MDGWLAGWKVVTANPPSSKPGWAYHSCSAPPGATVFYARGFATPRLRHCGPLYVFDDAEVAVAFARANFGWRRGLATCMVFPCLYRPSAAGGIWGPWDAWERAKRKTEETEKCPMCGWLSEQVLICPRCKFQSTSPKG